MNAKQLTEIERNIQSAGAAMRRVVSMRMGVISGGPSISDETAALCAARAQMIDALRSAGPRLRKQFGAADWEQNFNADGTPRL